MLYTNNIQFICIVYIVYCYYITISSERTRQFYGIESGFHRVRIRENAQNVKETYFDRSSVSSDRVIL